MRAEKFPRPSAGFCNCHSGAVSVPALSQNVLALAPLSGLSCRSNPTFPMLVRPVNSKAHVTDVTSPGTRTRRSLTVTMLYPARSEKASLSNSRSPGCFGPPSPVTTPLLA